MKKSFLIIISIIFIGQVFSQSKEVPFTLDDRDRIMSTEVELNSLRNEMKTEFSSVRDEISSLRKETKTEFSSVRNEFSSVRNEISSLRNEMNSKIDILFWGFGIVVPLILFLFGYIVFDRKTGIKPLEQDISIIKHRQNNLSKAMSELAQVDKKFAEAIKKVAL